MRIAVALLCLPLWLLYAGQVVSIINFPLAQRLGLQEKSDRADALFSVLETWAARWDTIWLWTLPAASILMLVDHPAWPYAALIGGGAMVDTGGREAAKFLGLKQHGVRLGSSGETRLAIGVYVYLLVAGALAIVAGLIAAS